MLGKHYFRRVKFIFQIGDLFFLNLAFIVASIITSSNLHFLPSEQTIIFLTMINVLWIVLALIIKLYRISRNIQLARKMFTAAIIISLHYLTVSFILKTSDTFDYDPIRIIYFYIFTYSLILTCKIILYKNLKFFRKLNHKSRSILLLRGSVSGNRNRIQHVV